MTWIKVQQSLRDHHKIIALADALDIEETHALGICVTLWIWAIDNAPDGLLPTTDRAMARGAGWTGDAARLVDALESAHLVDRVGDHRRIHDWDDHAGSLIEHRKQNVKRVQEWRSRNVTRNESVTNTQRTRTLQDKSRVEESREDKEKPPTVVKRNTRLPKEWQPTTYHITYAQGQGMDEPQIRRAVENFRDHFVGNGKTHADWDATWRRWVRTDLERKPHVNGNGRKPDMVEIARRLRAEENATL